MKFNALILKYNGKELQETGMYSYGWRDYMPDLGRWNGIDQLAESYLSTSPFAYVANNPVSSFDVDGRWMDDSGHITDTTGQTFGFHGSQFNPLLSFSMYDGMHTNEGAGVTDNGNNRIAQGPKPNIFKTIGNFVKKLFGRKEDKVEIGVVEPTTPYEDTTVFLEDTLNNWYSLIGKGNWFFSTAGVLSATAGVIDSQSKYSKGIRRGIAGNYELKDRNLSQFGNMEMTEATKPISKLVRNARFVGHFSFGIGVISDIGGMVTGQVSLGKALINTGFGAAGNWGGSIGASLSTAYFGVDGFYPGGWPGIFNDSNFVQGKLDEGFNQAGPYRINVFGAHEPK